MTGNEWFDRVQTLVRQATGNGHVERLEWGMDRPDSWVKHLYRYGFAASFVERGDVVLDAACGNGYGRPIIEGAGGQWYGADKDPPSGKTFVVDLESWVPPIDYDVFVGLETIEHLADPTAYLDAAKQARRRVILSTPIVPTKHFNGYHLRDVTKEEIEMAFTDWRIERYEEQAGVYGVWAFSRDEASSSLEDRVAALESLGWQPDEVAKLRQEAHGRAVDERLPRWNRSL